MSAPQANRAVFLDRDGVLVEDVHLLIKPTELRVLPGVPPALDQLHKAGFRLVVVSNQPVVARGLATEADVQRANEELNRQLVAAGCGVDAFYFCPHHPNATLPAYRVDCDCRKPKPGLLLRAAQEHSIELATSFMVGDRVTDIIAGAKAGCRTILVQTGRHEDAPIQTVEPIDTSVRPDWTCADLAAAADWILDQK